MRGTLKGLFAALLVVLAISVQEARAGGYYYAPPSYYTTVAYPVYPVWAYQPVYVAPVVPRPAIAVVQPALPVTYTTPFLYPEPVAYYPPSRVRVSRWGRKVETKYYTPFGTQEVEVKYDRYGRVRDIDYDFDD